MPSAFLGLLKLTVTQECWPFARALKLKLIGEPLDAARVRAVRDARPEVWLSVDANQGFSLRMLDAMLPVMSEARVQMIEQPFAVGQEAELDELDPPIPIAADESLQGIEDLPSLAEHFEVVNIKLDKCGSLTEGLAIAREAKRLGLKVAGTSLAMAPSYLIGQLCDVVDLDGPVLLKLDREPHVRYSAGEISCGEDLWGGHAR